MVEAHRLVPGGVMNPSFGLGSAGELRKLFGTLCIRDLGIMNGETVLVVLSAMITSCCRKIMAIAGRPNRPPWI